MPNSCKSIIKRLRHNGAITQAEFDKLMRKLDGWIPGLSCDKAYIENIWFEWCCDEKECPYQAGSEE